MNFLPQSECVQASLRGETSLYFQKYNADLLKPPLHKQGDIFSPENKKKNICQYLHFNFFAFDAWYAAQLLFCC